MITRLTLTFAALRYRNYRLWFFGQVVSLSGTWMQSVAQGWLVYQLTGSNLALGVVAFLGSVPALFLMLPAGALSDRVSRRRLLLGTQTTMMLAAFALATLAITRLLEVWHIGALAVVLGVANALEAPARLALAVELVDDRRDLMNAIALNSTLFNLARILGPAVGGIVLAAWGAAWCFFINGVSFLAVLAALLMMRLPDAPRAAHRESLPAQIAAGLRYVWRTRTVLAMTLLVAAASLFGFGYTALMPAYAADVLHVGETGLGNMNATLGLGALTGSLTVAFLGRFRRKGALLAAGSLLFPTALLLFAFSQSFLLSLALLTVVGFAFVTQNATSNTLIQAEVPDHLRGRVMAVYSLMFFGTAPFASLFAGAIAQAFGPPIGVAVGASLTLMVAVVVLLAVPALWRTEQ